MPDPDPNTEPTNTASQPGAAAPAAFDPSTLAPEALAWFEAEKRKASDAAAAAARRMEQERAKPRPTAATPTALPPAADDVTSLLALRDSFDDAIGDMPLKSTQKSLVREAVMRDRPADVPGYVARFAERAGWNTTAPAGAPQPAAPAPSTPVTPQAPAVPSTHRAPPPPTPVFTENTPILTIATSGNFAAIDKLVEEIGLDKFNERLLAEAKRTRVPLV